MNRAVEEAFIFQCLGTRLCAIVHRPDHPARRGVVIVVGGPQYRVGSHRQFVRVARALAADGIAVLRFDHRGIGDSEGDGRSFEVLEDDLHHAVRELLHRIPEVTEVVLWGLCDAASAAALYAHRDSRVTGVVMLNPWIRDQSSSARAYLRHYYPGRLLSASLWRKLFSGELDIARSVRGLLSTVNMARKAPSQAQGPGVKASGGEASMEPTGPLQLRMAEALGKFRGRILLILSGRDLTAREFMDVADHVLAWRRLLGEERVSRHLLEPADHTFSAREMLDEVSGLTSRWVQAERRLQ